MADPAGGIFRSLERSQVASETETNSVPSPYRFHRDVAIFLTATELAKTLNTGQDQPCPPGDAAT